MPTYYDFYQTPQPGDRNKRKKFHARVVPTGTVTLDDLAELMHECSTLTVGEVIGATSLLVECLTRSLKGGNRVHIPGLGYFLLSATSPSVRSTDEIRAESIKAGGISFRPDRSALKNIGNTTFIRVPEKRHSREQSQEDIEHGLTTYFASNHHITRRQFQSLCGLTRPTACRRLKEMVDEGSLRKEGDFHQFPLYVPVEGNFGR